MSRAFFLILLCLDIANFILVQCENISPEGRSKRAEANSNRVFNLRFSRESFESSDIHLISMEFSWENTRFEEDFIQRSNSIDSYSEILCNYFVKNHSNLVKSYLIMMKFSGENR